LFLSERVESYIIRRCANRNINEGTNIYNMRRAFIDVGAHPNILTLPLVSNFSGVVGYNSPFTLENDYLDSFNFDSGYLQATGERSYMYLGYYSEEGDPDYFNQDLFSDIEISILFKIEPNSDDEWYQIMEVECADFNYNYGMSIGMSWEQDYIDMWGYIYDENKHFSNDDIYEWRDDYSRNLADGEWHEAMIKIDNYRIYIYIDDELLLFTDYIGTDFRMDSILGHYGIGLDGNEYIGYTQFKHEKILEETELM
jgi:hypothetical protein